MSVVDIVDDPRIRERFISTYNKAMQSQYGEAFYTQAKESFLRTIAESDELRKCTALSLYSAFLDMSVLGINVAKVARPLAYLIPYNVKVGDNVWEKRASLEISPYGELAAMQNLGQIKYADNPILVREGDEFEVYVENGQKMVKYRKKSGSMGKPIVSGFMKIVRTDGSVDYFVMDYANMNRLKKYSEKKNKGVANALYGNSGEQADEGFIIAKIIKHAFKSYPRSPKLNMLNAKFQTDTIPDENLPEDPYGIDDGGEPEVVHAEEVPSSEPVHEAKFQSNIKPNESF